MTVIEEPETEEDFFATRGFAGLHKRLGGIPLHRIGMDPPPGMATEADVLRHLDAVDKRLYELIEGTLVEKAMGFRESMIGVYVGSRVYGHVKDRRLGIVAGADGPFKLTAGVIRYPDVSFVEWAAIPKSMTSVERITTLPPTFAVEVLSDSNTAAEIDLKLKQFFAKDCRLAWVIDPKKRIAEVYTSYASPQVLTADQTLDGGDVLPGFVLPLRDVFAAGELERPD
jgi:Uma2 family endonuclease